MDLSGKSILFLSAQAFGIPENIIATFRSFGADVVYYDERPANTFWVKASIRINRNLIARYIDRYHKKVIEETRSKKFDYIIFIKGESFSEQNLKTLFSHHPEAKTIIYHWDSIANNHNAINLLDHFDEVYSFDRNDCINFGIKFLPLFYYNEYRDIAGYKGKKEYDLMFVGTTHSDRYEFIKKIEQQICSNGGKCFTYFFFQGRIMFYKYKLQHRSMRHVSASDFHFKPLSKSTLLDLYRKSRIIVDVQHPRQTGLTLRTLEALGSKTKLITTNKDVRNYDFYNQNNILVVDRKNPIVPNEFLQAQYEDVPEEIYNRYSIDRWVDNLLR